MPQMNFDMIDIEHITFDAVGEPGDRVFYLQAKNPEQVITLLVEKFQIQTLALAIENLMSELREKLPDILDASPSFNEEEMTLQPPFDPLFAWGN